MKDASSCYPPPPSRLLLPASCFPLPVSCHRPSCLPTTNNQHYNHCPPLLFDRRSDRPLCPPLLSLLCGPAGLGLALGARSGGLRHRQRMCRPKGLERKEGGGMKAPERHLQPPPAPTTVPFLLRPPSTCYRPLPPSASPFRSAERSTTLPTTFFLKILQSGGCILAASCFTGTGCEIVPHLLFLGDSPAAHRFNSEVNFRGFNAAIAAAFGCDIESAAACKIAGAGLPALSLLSPR